MCLFLVKEKKQNWCKNQTISQREEGGKRKLHWLEGERSGEEGVGFWENAAWRSPAIVGRRGGGGRGAG